MRGGTIVATGITKEHGATVVLDRVSLTVPPGARLGVVGPNGAGKSTLLRILAGGEEPTAGRVERVGTVGYLPQEPERRDGETLLGYLTRRTAITEQEARMELGDADAVDRYLALGGADLDSSENDQVKTGRGIRWRVDHLTSSEFLYGFMR
jgi:ATPase subunit of ABC transporter with duplicated ATPase domains